MGGRAVEGVAMVSAKLGSEVKLRLAEAGAESDEVVDVLIRLRAEPDAAAVERIGQAGATVRTVAGDVVTASTTLRALEVIAELDDVMYLELSGPLY